MQFFQRKLFNGLSLLTAILLFDVSYSWAKTRDIQFLNNCQQSQAEVKFYVLNWGKGHIFMALDPDGGEKVVSEGFARVWSKNRYPKLPEDSILDHGRAFITLPNLALTIGDPGKIFTIQRVDPGQQVVINKNCKDVYVRHWSGSN